MILESLTSFDDPFFIPISDEYLYNCLLNVRALVALFLSPLLHNENFNFCLLQCEDPQCRVWQHISCVIIPEKPLEGVSLEVPSHFYCEMCRINRADPYVIFILVCSYLNVLVYTKFIFDPPQWAANVL